MSLTVEITSESTVPCLKAHGDIDIYSGNVLAQALGKLMALPYRWLALDLSDSDFLDTDGVAVLIRAHEQLRRKRRGLFISSASRGVRRTLSLLDLDFLLVRPRGLSQAV